MRSTASLSAYVAAGALLAACSGSGSGDDTDTAASQASAAAPGTQVGETTGLNVPESVKYDAELDVYYIANVNGNPSQADNNGYIARVHPDSLGTVTKLVEGGQNGVTLNAPKGMALRGDTLYVADINTVRMFNRRTGESLGSISLASQRATFLNDITAGPDGIYVTDTGIMFDAEGGMTHPGENRIFRIVGTRVSEAAKGDSLMAPNGITWDAANNRFVVAPFQGTDVLAWTSGSANPTHMVAGPGAYDGVEVLSDGSVLVSSWTDSTVHIIHGGTHMMPLVRNVPSPADIGVDTKRNLVLVPLFGANKVAYFRIR